MVQSRADCDDSISSSSSSTVSEDAMKGRGERRERTKEGEEQEEALSRRQQRKWESERMCVCADAGRERARGAKARREQRAHATREGEERQEIKTAKGSAERRARRDKNGARLCLSPTDDLRDASVFLLLHPHVSSATLAVSWQLMLMKTAWDFKNASQIPCLSSLTHAHSFPCLTLAHTRSFVHSFFSRSLIEIMHQKEESLET